MFSGSNYKELKYLKKAEIYSNSTGNNTYDPDAERAYSFRWWCFVRRIKGKLVFNNYSYSQCTNNHQSQMMDLFRKLKIKIEKTVYTESCLKKFESSALEPLYSNVFKLEVAIARKGSRRNSNKLRLKQIEDIKKTIKDYRELGAKFSHQSQKELRTKRIKKEIERVTEMQKIRRDKPHRSTNRMIKEATEFEIMI